MNAADLAAALGGKKSGAGWSARCPAHDDRDPSLSIDDGKNGHPVVRCHAGCEQEEVIDALRERGLWHERQHDEIQTTHPELGPYSSYWDYHDASGMHLLRACRWERDGGKEFRPLTFQDGHWQWKQFKDGRPLYRLPALSRRPGTRLLVVEGEKTADAAVKLFGSTFEVTTWSGGSRAGNKTDWQPLAGRDVTLVADNDEAGRKAMADVAAILRGIACTVRHADLSPLGTLPDGWDIADALGDQAIDLDVLNGAIIESHAATQSLSLETAAGPRRLSIALKDIQPVLIVNYNVKDVLSGNSIAGLIAESGAGKSFAMIYMAAHAAKGLRWHGRRTRGGLWWYCCREGFGPMQNRFAALKREYPDLADAPVELDGEGVSLNDKASVLAFIARVREKEKELGIRLAVVVIDTLAWAMPGGSENDPKDMGEALDGARTIRDALGCTIALIHHLGKDTTKGARGHSSLKAALDTELSIEKRGKARVIKDTKQRDFEDGRELASFKLEVITLGKDQDGDDVTTCVARAIDLSDIPVSIKAPTGKNQKRLLAELERRAAADLKAGQLSVWTELDLRRICKELGIGRQKDRDAVLGLRQLGYFTATVGGDRLAHLPCPSETQK